MLQPKTLTAIQHILELALLAARQSEDGLARLSVGTLATEITRRWPDCPIQKSAVSIHLDRITAGTETCLIQALTVEARPVKMTDATGYALGPDLIKLVPAEAS